MGEVSLSLILGFRSRGREINQVSLRCRAGYDDVCASGPDRTKREGGWRDGSRLGMLRALD